MRWTTDEIYVPRNIFRGAVVKPEVKKDAEDEDGALRDVLFDVLRRFPDAHTAVVRALEERMKVLRARRRNNGDG